MGSLCTWRHPDRTVFNFLALSDWWRNSDLRKKTVDWLKAAVTPLTDSLFNPKKTIISIPILRKAFLCIKREKLQFLQIICEHGYQDLYVELITWVFFSNRSLLYVTGLPNNVSKIPDGFNALSFFKWDYYFEICNDDHIIWCVLSGFGSLLPCTTLYTQSSK